MKQSDGAEVGWTEGEPHSKMSSTQKLSGVEMIGCSQLL